MMGSATRVCPDVASMNMVDSETCVAATQMQPDTESSLDLQLEDSMMMMPSPAGPVFVGPTMELIQEPGNEYGEDSLQTNLDIMYLETFGNMSHANQLAEIAQIEDELKLQQQLQVENEFKNADHLQNGVQLQNMVFNFETENDGLDNERRDLFEEIDIEPPPIAIPTPAPMEIQENDQEDSAVIKSTEVITNTASPKPLPQTDLSEAFSPSLTHTEDKIQESPAALEMQPLSSPKANDVTDLQENRIESQPAPVANICEESNMDENKPNENLADEVAEMDQEKENHENVDLTEKAVPEISSESEDDQQLLESQTNNGRMLIDINSMKKIIDNRKLNKPFRVPLVPKYLHDGLDEDDELLRAFNARQDESMTCICVLCYEWVEDKPALAAHMLEKHRDNTTLEKCKVCHRTFFARFLRLRHEKVHKYDPEYHHSLYYPSVSKPFDYLVPNHFYKRFKFAPFTKEYSQKIKDITKELANVPYECCDCGKVFKGEEPLREHYERSHAVQICPICKGTFVNMKALRKHQEENHDLRAAERDYQGGAWQAWRDWEEEKFEEMKTNLSIIESLHTYAYREDESEELDARDLIERAIEKQLDTKTGFKRPFSVDESVVPVNPKRLRHSANKKSVPVTLGENSLQNEPQPLTKVPVPIPSSQPDLQSFPSKCDICQEQFSNSEDMLLHVQKSHNTERPYKCQFCGRGFATHSNRKEHERIHTGERPYVCIFCNRGFVQISNLKKHMQTHKDKNNLQCKTCGKQFVKESSLILHQRAHAVDRKFKCTHCDKAYNYSSLLKRHERIHTGEMPYSCDICMMPFHELVSLTYHRKKVHTGERPHKCNTCGRAFILSSDLKKHMKVHWRDANKEEEGGEGSEGSDSDSIDSLLRRELLEDGQHLNKSKVKNPRTYVPNKSAAATANEKYKNKDTNNVTESSGDVQEPQVEIYEVYDDELQEINQVDSKVKTQRRKSKSSFKKEEAELTNNDNDRDTTVVWVENGDNSEDKFLVLDDDGNVIDGESIEICEVYDD